MASTYKVLGQKAPNEGVTTDLYTVPASTQAVVSTIVIANRSSGAGTFRLAVRPNGSLLSNQNYLAYDTPISANDSITLTLGITLGANDVITVVSNDVNDLSYNAFGSEIT